jgi:hypothetical protein
MLDPLNYFERTWFCFQAAQQEWGSHDRFYRIGDQKVQLRFASTDLMPIITPALAHLELSSQQFAQNLGQNLGQNLERLPLTSDAVTLQVCLWHSSLTDRYRPPSPWQEHGSNHTTLDMAKLLGHQGELWQDDRFYGCFQMGSEILTLFDGARSLALYWVRDLAKIPYYEKGAPLRQVFHWWAGFQNKQLVHGAAIGGADGGVLLVGKGNTGKSTSAFACLNTNLCYAGDDYCLVAAEPQPQIDSLYNTGKLKSLKDLQRFPLLAELYKKEYLLGFDSIQLSIQDPSHSEKIMIFFQDYFADRIITKFPLKAIILPQVVVGKVMPMLKPISAAKGLIAIAPSTVFQLPRRGQSPLKIMTSLVKQLPCYVLELGSEIQHIPVLISTLLKASD